MRESTKKIPGGFKSSYKAKGKRRFVTGKWYGSGKGNALNVVVTKGIKGGHGFVKTVSTKITSNNKNPFKIKGSPISKKRYRTASGGIGVIARYKRTGGVLVYKVVQYKTTKFGMKTRFKHEMTSVKRK